MFQYVHKHMGALKLKLIYLIWKVTTFIVFKLKLEDQITHMRRQALSHKAYAFYQGEIMYGLFKGLLIHEQSAWSGSSDTGSKILGLYEKQIQLWISERHFESIVFLDIGASDGYYAAGMVKSKVAKTSIAYEVSSKDRNNIKSLSTLNDLSSKVEVRGKATSSSIINDLKNEKIKLMLIDIEGEEYNLINEELLFAAKDCFILIEVHKYEDEYTLDRFFDLCKTSHTVEQLHDFQRNMPRDSFTLDLTDNERVLLFSEGRAYGMTWLALSPKNVIGEGVP